MQSHASVSVVPVTVPGLQRMKREGTRIVSLTAYDFSFARLMDRAGVDLLLVGDSLGMVIQGHANTLPVTLEQMIYHTSAVVRGVQRAMVVCDLPFGVCHGGGKAVMDAAVRVLKEGGCQAVKLEGGVRMAESIRYLVAHEVPVMGHVGLTPQAVHRLGGFRVQGRGDAAELVMADAIAVQEAGAFAVVLEGIPAVLAERITEHLQIPTIGIGAGVGCDGQVLVMHDLLGVYGEVVPRFAKRYLADGMVSDAVAAYVQEVRGGWFPGPEHSFMG
ncbi:MAG: 3-methyl-2-oxobutanoate hydroxymethyltransferase [Magnetococcales bacterium]|nr:3-methyl-2-oxobutanoate hydroxymethyltransferase [Magnetococcales bacterium]MBF0113545.1 3-methyl-2-oxobutanoate hydroxymethyltransferase [Magnetococcales bacterium]